MGLLAIILLCLLGWGLWKIVIFTANKQEHRNTTARYQQETEKAKEDVENKNYHQLQKQKELVEKFVTSAVTQEILRVICKGNPEMHIPHEILIRDNLVTGHYPDGVCTFDFAANQVHAFQPVGSAVWDKEEIKYIVRPQVAIAEALNKLLANQYAISDNARVEMDRHTDCDGDPYYIYTYYSDNVKMVLKPTLPNRSF